MEIGLVGRLIILIISLMVILGVIRIIASRADADSALTICRGSLALKEYSNVGIGDNWLFGDTLNYDLAPLLCKTFDLKFPEEKYPPTRDSVVKNIADRTADCWWQFGEGLVETDVFEKNLLWGRNKCFICYTFSTDTLKEDEVIKIEEVYDYMASSPYKAISDDRAVCGSKEAEENSLSNAGGDQGSEVKCIDQKTPECERKGGNCRDYCTTTTESEFYDWACLKKSQKCCVNNENLVTYLDYIYYAKGTGVVSVGDNMGAFEKKQTYAIAFISQTTDFGWTMIDIASYFIPGAGKLVGSGVKWGGKIIGKTGFKLFQLGAKLDSAAVPKILKFASSNAGYNRITKIMAVESQSAKVADRIFKITNPIKNIPKADLANKYLYVLGASGATALEEHGEEEVKDIISGSPQILMIAPLDDITDICNVQKEVGQG